MNLRYCLITAHMCGLTRHPQEIMRDLGISYALATPQSISDSWWFWCCSNVPEALPEFLKPLARTPHEAIGFGLSKRDADMICEIDKSDVKLLAIKEAQNAK